MGTNWKSLMFNTILLAALSLFLFGCGGGGTSKEAAKEVTGTVFDSTTGLPISNAKVTAYAIDADGVVSTTQLADTRSNGQGSFTLKLPKDYAGSVMVEAELSGSVEKTAKQTELAPAWQIIRAILPPIEQGQTEIPPVFLSMASEILVQYIESNNASKFTPDNVQAAVLALEPLFGLNFTQIPPVAIGSTPTPAQQNLLVTSRLFDLLLSSVNSNTGENYTIADLVTIGDNGQLGLATATYTTPQGQTQTLAETITDIVNDLAAQGLVTGSRIQTVSDTLSQAATAVIPVFDLSDKIPPSTPQNLTATATTSSVTLTWAAATDNVGVTEYYVYRDGVFLASINSSTTSYTDNTVSAGTTYIYEVMARDAVGNVSETSTTFFVTTVQLPAVYTISGKVTLNDNTGLPSVYITVSGTGTGVVVTDAHGNYTITGARAGSYTIVPVFSSYSFTPPSRTVVVTNANVTGVDFIAALVTPGTVVGDVTYPPGVIIGGISYPSGVIIGGITYPTSTVIGGVTYPTGSVVGGVTYPNGVVIGGVTYPSGTIIGGVAYPNGTVIGGVTYPSGTIIGGEAYPNGVVIGGVTYPSGTIIGGVAYPNNTVIGDTSYPTSTVTGESDIQSGTLGGVLVFL